MSGEQSKSAAVRNFLPHLSRRFIGLVLMLFGAALIAVVASFLIWKYFSAPSLPRFLPLEQTVAFAEIKFSPLIKAWRGFADRPAFHSAYDFDRFRTIFNDWSGLDFDLDVVPWLGGSMGAAMLNDSEAANSLATVFFLRTDKPELALKAMTKLQMSHPEDGVVSQKIGGFTVYGYKIANNLHFFFASDHLIVADSLGALRQTIKVLNREEKSLSRGGEYNRSSQSGGGNNLLFAYLDISKALSAIGKNPAYARFFGGEISSWFPLLRIYKSTGVSVSATANGFNLRTYTAVNKKSLNDEVYFSKKDKYRGELFSWVPRDAIAVFGGQDFGGQIQRFESLLAEVDPNSGMIFQRQISRLLRSYLGETAPALNELLAYLNREYLFFVSGSVVDPQFTLLLELNKDLAALLPFLETSFIKYAAGRLPIEREFTLADGDTAREIVIDLAAIVKNREETEGGTLVNFVGPAGEKLLTYALKNNYFLIGNNAARIASLLQKITAADRQNHIFSRGDGAVVLASADEVGSISLKALWPSAKFLPPAMLPYFLPFESVFSGRQFFDDGVVSEYFFQLASDETENKN